MNQKKLNQSIILLGLMLFFLQGDNYASAPVIVDLIKEFGLTLSNGVWTVASYMIPFGIFTLLFGPLGDRYGKVRLLKTASILTALFSLASALMPTFTMICLARVFNGMFAAAVMPVSMALIGDLSDSSLEKLQGSLAKTMSLMFLGGAVGPIIGGWLSYFGSWRAVYGAYGLMELMLALIIIFAIPASNIKNKDQPLFSTYQKALSSPGVIRTVPLVFLIGLSVLGIFPFMGKYAEKLYQLNLHNIGLLLTCFGLGSLIGGRIAHSLFKKVKNLIFPIAGTLGVVSMTLMVNAATHLILFAVGLVAFGLSFMLLQPILVARIQQMLHKTKGTAMSLISLNMATGGGLGTLLYGSTLNQWGFVTIIVMSGGIFLCASILAWISFRRAPAFAS